MNIKDLGLADYTSTWKAMQDFTKQRTEGTRDEIWLLEHPPVYTQGQAGKIEHILNPQSIPIVQTDRGGQVTYHGPGQLVAYVLIDLKRLNMNIKTLVSSLEEIIIQTLNEYQISSQRKCKAPGVYVGEDKIASIGLRVKNGCSYHGIALNTAMDLTPFKGINPCGYSHMRMTQISDYKKDVSLNEVKDSIIKHFISILGNQNTCKSSTNICNL